MRRTELRAVPPPDRTSEPGYREWHAPVYGRCAVCGERGRLVRHHVVMAQHCQAEGADPWDLRNSMGLGMHCRCHRAHHAAAERIRVACLPDAAIDFCVDVFGPGAGAYLSRYYSA